MTVHLLEVAPRDVAADALGLLLGAPAPTALAELVVRRGDDRLVLGVLGSSHVVTARAGTATCVEQVSCEAAAAGGLALPERHTDGGYAFCSSTRAVAHDELTALADDLRERAGSDPAWLCGTFPTSGAAVTALTGGPVPGGWSWRTWHLYPDAPGGTVVTTSTRWVP